MRGKFIGSLIQGTDTDLYLSPFNNTTESPSYELDRSPSYGAATQGDAGRVNECETPGVESMPDLR